MKTIWCLFAQPEGDCHQNDLRVWWSEKPDAEKIVESFDSGWYPEVIQRELAQSIADEVETNFAEFYWTLKQIQEGVWQ